MPTRPVRKRFGMWTLLASLCALGAGPCAIIPGGALDGEVASPPSAGWSFLGDSAACDIEVRPADPHSIRATCLQHDGRLYVRSISAARKNWPSLAMQQPEVRVRIEGLVYPLRANRILDVATRVKVIGEDPPSDSTWLWELAPR